MRILSITALAVLLLSIIPVHADRGTGGIALSANPSGLPADGTSFCTISAEVRDSDGKFAPDGTEIRFTASLGDIEEVAEVRAGVARVRLMSANIPGTSTVTATWIDGQAVSRMTVVFGGKDIPKGPEYIDVRADDYMAYSVDHQALEAIGKVRLRYRSLQLEAQSVQVDLARSRIIAKGGGPDSPVRLISGKDVLECSMFTCDLFASQGLMLSAQKGKVQSLIITGSGWSLGPDQTMYLPEEFDFTDLSDSGILVKATQATIFPMQRIQFRRASVYVDGKRMLSLPLYVLSLTGYQENGEQYVGYGTSGITLNLPFYYALSPRSTGAMLIRHGESTGWGDYGQTPGWFIDLRQQYATDKSQGMLSLNHVTDRWGAQFTHSQQLGSNTNAYMFIEYPAHRDLYGTMNLRRSFKRFSIGLDMFGSKYRTLGQSTYGGDVHIQTQSANLGKLPLKYTLSARADRSTGTTVRSGLTTGVVSTPLTTSQRIDANLYTNPISLSKSLSLRGSSSLGYLFDNTDLTGPSFLGNAVMNWKMSRQNNLQINYRYSSRPSYQYRDMDPDDGVFKPVRVVERAGSQSVSASLRLGHGDKWSANVFALQGLNYVSSNVFADFNYRLSKGWRFTVRTTENRYQYSKSVVTPNPSNPSGPPIVTLVPTIQHLSDMELGLGKVIGGRELFAVWSKKEGRVMLELGSSGF